MQIPFRIGRFGSPADSYFSVHIAFDLVGRHERVQDGQRESLYQQPGFDRVIWIKVEVHAVKMHLKRNTTRKVNSSAVAGDNLCFDLCPVVLINELTFHFTERIFVDHCPLKIKIAFQGGGISCSLQIKGQIEKSGCVRAGLSQFGYSCQSDILQIKLKIFFSQTADYAVCSDLQGTVCAS